MTTINDIKEAASTAKEKVQEVRRTASQYVGQAGTGSEEALHTAASAIRNAGTQSADVIDGIAQTTGRKLATAASYLDPSAESTCSMAEDLRKMVLRHPGSFLLAAAAFAGAVGFMAGSSRNGNGGSNY